MIPSRKILLFILLLCRPHATEQTSTAFITPRYLHSCRKISRNNIVSELTTTASSSTDTAPYFAVQDEQQYRHQHEPQPLAVVPMQRLKLPKMAAGKEFVVVPLKVNGEGPFDFMIDTALTAELISPHLQKKLGISDEGAGTIEGLAAGGSKKDEKLVMLEGASLTTEDGHELKLPSMHAVVTPFPQEHIDPSHQVEGMLGIEFLEGYDVDLDFPAGKMRLWPAGTGAAVAEKAGMISIPAAIMSDTMLLAIRVTSDKGVEKASQPFLGILDCGSSFTAVNWEAAKLLGLPKNKLTYIGSPTIMAVGVDGKPLPLPTREVRLSFVGDATKDETGKVHFEPPPDGFQPWDKVRVGIGDLPIFSLALGEDEDHPFNGPAAVIGLDVLGQRRMIFETCTGTLHCSDRRRHLYVQPK